MQNWSSANSKWLECKIQTCDGMDITLIQVNTIRQLRTLPTFYSGYEEGKEQTLIEFTNGDTLVTYHKKDDILKVLNMKATNTL